MQARDVGEEREPRRFEVGPTQGGTRLDKLLAAELGLSRAAVRHLLERGSVQVGGREQALADKGRTLAQGDQVEVAPFDQPGAERIEPEPDAPLSVLASGEGWLAVDKPAGAGVHPLREGDRGTLLAAVAARHPAVQGVGEGGLRSGVVHRLDVDTSGVLLVATQSRSWERLRAAFREHRVYKRYRAVVLGEVTEAFEQRLGLVVAQHRPARVRVVEAARARGAHPWVTEQRVRPLEALRGATLVEVEPRTGFLHQIRATLAHVGHPVSGDATYGPAGDPSGAPRQLLHAEHVAFEEIEATSPDPADFAEALERLRG